MSDPYTSDQSASHPAIASGPRLDDADLLLPADYLSYHASGKAGKTALVFQQHSWTYAELDRACDAMVTVLSEFGITSGGRLAYMGKNSDVFFIVLLATIRAGAVLVPINWRNTAAETRYVLDDSEAGLIIADREFEELLNAANVSAVPVIVADSEARDGLRTRIAAAKAAKRTPLNSLAPCLQLYTSGTTGNPKGVVTSQYAFGVSRLIEKVSGHFDDWGEDEILLSPLPAFHIGGMSWVCTGLYRGSTIHIIADTTPSVILDSCLEHGVTRTFLVPTLVRALLGEMDARGERVSSLRGIHYGAASMDPALLERSVDRIGCRFLQYFGMTEITGTMTILGPGEHGNDRPHLLRSVGRPLPGYSVSIRNAEGQILPLDTPGEIWVKGPTLMIEYWNQPAATAEALVDGWYRTGDGGRLDAEGYLFLTDRIKDMIVSGGENVYPAEVEAVLRDHPAILDCAVFGLPDPKWGEGVAAALELRPDHSVTAEEVIAYARKSLAAYKIPRRIEIGFALPRTASGKVQRRRVREHFLNRN